MATQKSTYPGFGYLLNDVTRHLRRQFDRRAERFGLTRAQWRTLKAIAHEEGLSQTAVAELIEMEPIPVGRVIDRLEQSGFVQRRADPADRRRWCLYVTPAARAVIDDMADIANALRADALHGLRAAEIDATIAVLNRVKDNLVALDRADRQAP